MALTWLRNRAEPEEAGPDLYLDFDRLDPDHHVFVCEEPGVRRHRQRQGADRDSAQDEGAEGQRFGATVHRCLENLHRLKGNCHHRVVVDQPRIRYIVSHITCRCWYICTHNRWWNTHKKSSDYQLAIPNVNTEMERCHPFIDWYETFLCTWLAGMCYIFPPEHWSLTAVVWLAHKQALSPLRCISYIQLSPIVFGATHANGLINLWYSLGQSESLAKYLISVVFSNQSCSMSGKNMEGNKLVSGLPFARRLVIYGFSSKGGLVHILSETKAFLLRLARVKFASIMRLIT